jgi:hypothetical protein
MEFDIEMDETTFVTISNEVSHLQSPRRSPEVPVEASVMEVVKEVTVPEIQVQNGSVERSVTPPIPSPSFTGFHSARSWQPATPGLTVTAESGNFEGHTLVGGETPSAIANEDDPSYLSFLSANQSFEDTSLDMEQPESGQEQEQEQDRQIFSNNPVPPAESGGSGPQSGSLLSTIGMSGDGASDSYVAINASVEDHGVAPTSSAQSWKDLLKKLGNSEDEEDEDADEESEESQESKDSSGSPEDGDDEDQDEDEDQNPPSPKGNYEIDGSNEQVQDSMDPSNLELDLGYESPSPYRSSSPKPPPSAQKEAQPQPEQSPPSLATEPPAASTRLKLSQRSRESISESQISASQMSEMIDLTSSTNATPDPHPAPQPELQNTGAQSHSQSQRSKSERFNHHKGETAQGRKTRASTTGMGRLQEMAEVSISPSRQTGRKRRSSRKF